MYLALRVVYLAAVEQGILCPRALPEHKLLDLSKKVFMFWHRFGNSARVAG